jgi:hypothetical protein
MVSWDMSSRSSVPRGPIRLDSDSAGHLARLARALGRPPSLAIDPAAIEDVEAELRTVIPYGVIALLAVEQRLPAALVELTESIRTFHEAQEQPLGALGFDHVAFALLSDTGEWGDEPCFGLFRRTSDRTAPAGMARWDLRKPVRGGQPFGLAEYLDERWHLGTDAPASPPITVTIEPPAPQHVFVVHATFGRGRLRARGEGKVTVEFDDGTTRTLAERFVTPSD